MSLLDFSYQIVISIEEFFECLCGPGQGVSKPGILLCTGSSGRSSSASLCSELSSSCDGLGKKSRGSSNDNSFLFGGASDGLSS